MTTFYLFLKRRPLLKNALELTTFATLGAAAFLLTDATLHRRWSLSGEHGAKALALQSNRTSDSFQQAISDYQRPSENGLRLQADNDNTLERRLLLKRAAHRK